MVVENRSEILFLYDVRDANPNGDPDENKPRIDEETEINFVTDVRLKRTIRDYLLNFLNCDIWVREETGSEGMRKTREEKLTEEKIGSEKDAQELLKKYIDLRLFGATIAGKKKPTGSGGDNKKGEAKKGEWVFKWTGPVQFKFGRSLHRVEPMLVKGTSILPSKEERAAGTFTEVWILPYSLICFYGVINENAAKTTGLMEDDISKLMDGIWNGTKNLITRSKFGQVPRLLMRVVYNDKNYHIGDLDKGIRLLDLNRKEVDKEGKNGKEIRSIFDVKLDLTHLIGMLSRNSNKIREITVEVHDDVSFIINGKEIKGKQLVKELNQDELNGKIIEMKIDR
ncbi:MAG: type I-B CRISPR-associated protein Cas7/Csh2 [Methanomassiliicoccales archaeon]|jgi:CRISPR-associated protein Csh2